MTQPPARLYKHGEFTALETPAGSQERAPKPLDKNRRASETPHAFGDICRVYPDVIEFQHPDKGATGLGLMFCVLCVGLVVFFEAWRLPLDAYEGVVQHEAYGLIPFYVLELAMAFILVPRWMLAAWRTDMFVPESEPTLFDRARRKVYRLIVPPTTWRISSKPLPMMALEYEWKAIAAEHRIEEHRGHHSSYIRFDKLILLVYQLGPSGRGEPHNRLLTQFVVRTDSVRGQDTVPRVWEHIRRFMEEGGPPLAQGDHLTKDERPRSLWQSMGATGPFGPKFFHCLRSPRLRGLTLLMLVFLPVTLPLTWAWAMCYWISQMTIRPTAWPDELVQRLGPPLSREQVLALQPKAASNAAANPTIHVPELSKGKRWTSRGFHVACLVSAGMAGYRWYVTQYVEADVVAYGLIALACFAFGAVIGRRD